jgi:AcrR family transcriptional regulator
MGSEAADGSTEVEERILEAARTSAMEQLPEEVTLEAIAERAGVSVGTILEHFESKERLFEAVVVNMGARIVEQRSGAPVGDVATAARIMSEHYEEFGEAMLGMLREEHRHAEVQAMMKMGRNYHRDWCARVFSPTLERLEGAERERRLAQLVMVTDIYAWKVMREEQELSARETETALRELLEGLSDPDI